MTHAESRKRYREIGLVLTRHGFDWLWTKWGVGKVLGDIEQRLGATAPASRTEPEKLRMALEELGTTFIKIGQILSTRPDLLPPDYITELVKLQDHAETVPYSQISAEIVAELGDSPDEIFGKFESEPRAAASIAQVHNALLKDGTRVVVKVRRPGIERVVNEDLAILGQLARFLVHNTEFGKSHDVEGLVDEFAYTLRNELDFVREGQNAERIAAKFGDDPAVHVPKIYWEYSTHGVLTMEEIGGIKIDHLSELDAAGIDRKELADRCAHIALVQVLEHGFFHADPHPGNFFVQADGSIGLIDFGMVGRLGERLRGSLLRLSLAVTRHDTERLIDELLALGAAKGAVNRHELGREIEHLQAQYDGVPMGEISAGRVFGDITNLIQRNGLTLPSDLVMLARVVAMDEGMGAMLNPDFNLFEFAQPYFKKFWIQNHSMRANVKRARDLVEMGSELPETLMRLAGMMERGEVRVATRLEVEEDLSKTIQEAANRIAISALTAGLIICLSVVALIYRPSGSDVFGYFLLRGLLILGLGFGAWLLVAFWKSSRRSGS